MTTPIHRLFILTLALGSAIVALETRTQDKADRYPDQPIHVSGAKAE